jgi:hypothetical protein
MAVGTIKHMLDILPVHPLDAEQMLVPKLDGRLRPGLWIHASAMRQCQPRKNEAPGMNQHERNAFITVDGSCSVCYAQRSNSEGKMGLILLIVLIILLVGGGGYGYSRYGYGGGIGIGGILLIILIVYLLFGYGRF